MDKLKGTFIPLVGILPYKSPGPGLVRIFVPSLVPKPLPLSPLSYTHTPLNFSAEHDQLLYKLFFVACQHGDIKICEFIYQTDPNVIYGKTIHGIMPLLFAIKYNHLELCKWIHKVDPSQISSIKMFMYTCFEKQVHIDISKFILENDPKQISIKTLNGFSPFYMACINNKLDLCKLIYEKDPSQISFLHNGFTPFYAACDEGNIDICKFIYETDPTQISVSCNGYTPFFLLSKKGNLDICKFIHERDPKQLSIRSFDECTPLYTACYYRHIELCMFILENDPSQINISYKKIVPFYAACVLHYTDIAKLIYEKYVNKSDLQHYAYLSNNIEMYYWIDEKIRGKK